MKKHNEGYSLVLVLVVLTLMSLVASFILSVSLKNLQSQTAAVNRMEQEYAAAGEIEKIVAELEAFIHGTDETAQFDTIRSADTGYSAQLSVIAESNNQLLITVYFEEKTTITCVVELTNSSIQLGTDLVKQKEIVSITKSTGEDNPTELKYISYEVGGGTQ